VVILRFSCYELGLEAYLNSDRAGSFHILSKQSFTRLPVIDTAYSETLKSSKINYKSKG